MWDGDARARARLGAGELKSPPKRLMPLVEQAEVRLGAAAAGWQSRQAQRRKAEVGTVGNPPTPPSVVRPGQRVYARTKRVCQNACEAALVDRYQMRVPSHTILSPAAFAASKTRPAQMPRDDAGRKIAGTCRRVSHSINHQQTNRRLPLSFPVPFLAQGLSKTNDPSGSHMTAAQQPWSSPGDTVSTLDLSDPAGPQPAGV